MPAPTSGVRPTLVVLDTAVLAVAVLVGYAVRFGEAAPRGPVPYVLVAPALVLAWLVSLKALRCYDDRVVGYGADEYRRVSMASLRLAGATAIAGYVADVGSPGASWPSPSRWARSVWRWPGSPPVSACTARDRRVGLVAAGAGGR